MLEQSRQKKQSYNSRKIVFFLGSLPARRMNDKTASNHSLLTLGTHGQSLEGWSPWCCKELDMTERHTHAHTHTHTHTHTLSHTHTWRMNNYRQCQNNVVLEWILNLNSNVDKCNILAIKFKQNRIHIMKSVLRKTQKVMSIHYTGILSAKHWKRNCSFNNCYLPSVSGPFSLSCYLFPVTLLC